MDRPKRRKNKDNPYTLLIEDNKYYVLFTDSKYILNKIEISQQVFNAFNQFELDDKKMMNEFDRHIEHYNLNEENIYIRSNYKEQTSFDDDLIKKCEYEKLRKAINELLSIQKNRIIKYFFENKTYKEIALEEHCSKVAIKYSIDNALEKISKKFKN